MGKKKMWQWWQPKPVMLFLVLIVLFFLVSNSIAPSSFSVDPWLGPLWLAESMAFIITALLVLQKPLINKLPWILAGIACLLMNLYILDHQFGFSDVAPPNFKSPPGRVFFVLSRSFPYTNPFNRIDKDYLLYSSAPEFIETQVFVLTPFAIGYVVRAQLNRSHRISSES